MKCQKYLLHLQNNFKHKCINDTNYQKIKDHDHYTGEHRGAAHTCL